MSLRISIAIIATAVGLISGFGCNINTCEEGAHCDDWDDEDRGRQTDACTAYCGRVSICGGAQAADFDGCVASCEKRFEVLPDETARICACAEWSSCSDVNEGRCSNDGPSGSGGSASCPGGCNSGSGGTASNGGSPASSGGSASGGTPAGGSAGTGTSGQGGSEDPGTPCTADCDCAGGTLCIDGYCSAA